MYTLYTDKQEIFECSISLEGASIKNTSARLILESDRLSLVYKGTVDASGKCIIPVKQLKNLLDESTNGIMRLEVIADDTYFTPWESKFKVVTSKKITVEVANNSKKPLIQFTKPIVSVNTTNNANTIVESNINLLKHVADISKILKRANITLNNMNYNKHKLNRIIESYLQLRKIPDDKKIIIIEGIIQSLIKQ